MKTISDLFDVEYGQSLELNRLSENPKGINFVSRTAKNNGVSARVSKIDLIPPLPAGTITVSLSGSVLEAFLQPSEYYTSFHVYSLSPKQRMTVQELLFYCQCIRLNKYRYNYGRQANRTLRDILIPSPSQIPKFVNSAQINIYDNIANPFFRGKTTCIDLSNWKYYEIGKLFELKKGKRLTKASMKPGNTPFIGAIDSNNGWTNFISKDAIHDSNTITVNYNGNGVAEAYYQPVPFWATDDANVLYPRFKLNKYIAMFICTVIRHEKYRFSYGRKWHLERMKLSEIKLPSSSNGEPDFDFMERFIKSLNFSKML
jgi:hypothetical protein